MKAVVMAGGFGTRIQPLTHSVPKPMLPVLGRPMMEHIMIRLRDVGVTEFVILLYFKPEVVMDYFGDGSDLGVKIDYILPDDDYGTAGAVKKAEHLLDETFMIVSGDLITDFDLNKILRFHEKNHANVTITLTSVPDPLQFGVVITDGDGKIQRFLEKPGWGEVFSDTINTGVYVMEPEVLKAIPENTNYDFSKDLFPGLMDSGETLWGYNASGYWRDVGNPQSYRDVMKDLLAGSVDIKPLGKRKKMGDGIVFAEKGTTVPSDLNVSGTVVLGKNVHVAPGVKLENVILGDNVRVESGAKLKNITIWHDVLIGEEARLNDAVICNNCSIDRKTKIPHGAILAEHIEVGRGVQFEKDVIVWPNKIIEEASIVSKNVIWGDKYKKSIFEGGQVRGHTNIEFSCEMATKLAEAFASTLPVGAKVFVSRDYHKASRMLKRSFMAGLMSAGIETLNIHFAPSNVLRFILPRQSEAVAGIHFRQSETNALETEVLFYNADGLSINTNTEKSVERIFFRENFRRVSNEDIGSIEEYPDLIDEYYETFLTMLDTKVIASVKPRLVVDLLFGSTSTVYPEILNAAGIGNVMVNAYADDHRLSRMPNTITTSRHDMSRMIRSLDLFGGLLIYPHGMKLEILDEQGQVLDNDKTLLVMLKLLDATVTEEFKVYLPVAAPDVLDSTLKNVKITRGKMNNLDGSLVKHYDMVATLNREFAFTDFSPHFDALFAGTKMVEMLCRTGQKLSEVAASIPNFYFLHEKIPCEGDLKGTMMRRFTEESMGKEASFVDGVKIRDKEGSQMVMIPDQYGDHLHLYIQAKSQATGEALFTDYSQKIAQWKER